MPKKPISTGELTGPSWDATVEKVARQIYDDSLNGPISEAMVKQMAAELMKGVFEGYGMDFESKELATADFEMLQAIEKNVFIFSGFKNFQQLREVSDLLKDGDTTTDFKSWFEGVRKIDATYNQTYARAEYNTATTTAISISREQTFQKEKETLPYLEWIATGDEAECDVCGDLDGTILHVDDPFWDTHGIPVHFNCQCTKVQRGPDTDTTPTEEIPNPVYPDSWKMFKTNAADTGVIFPEKHPYYEASKAQKQAIIKAVTPLMPERTPPTSLKDSFTKVNKSVSAPLNSAVEAIDKTLALPEMPKLEITTTNAANTNGYFAPGQNKIALKPTGRNVELTAAHELGHYIDFNAFTKGRFETDKPDLGKLKAVFDAINKTDNVTRLNAALKTGKFLNDEGKEMMMPLRKEVKNYLKYLTTDIELWARAFSQYIAYKNEDEAMMLQCERLTEGHLYSQWKPNDFKNVIFAMDKTFEDLGWLKK